MDDLNKLKDLVNTEISNQIQYNKYMIYIQNPEIRQIFIQLRDNKMQQITKLQEVINKI